jgi:hypothetical protein
MRNTIFGVVFSLSFGKTENLMSYSVSFATLHLSGFMYSVSFEKQEKIFIC